VAAAQVPSPRQYVLADAPVPLLSLLTGRLPVTSVARSTSHRVMTDPDSVM